MADGNEELILRIGVDSTQALEALTKTSKATDNFGASAEKTSRVVEGLGKAMSNLDKSTGIAADEIQIIADEAQRATAKLLGLSDAGDKVAGSMAKVAGAGGKADTAMVDGASAARDEAGAMGELAGAADRAAGAEDRLAGANDRASGSMGRVAGKATAQAAAMDSFAGKSQRVVDKLSAMGSPALYRAATAGILGIGAIAYESIKQYTDFTTKFTQIFTQAHVSWKKQGDLMKGLSDIAKSTGKNFGDLADNMYRVASATSNFNNGKGATSNQLIDLTRQVANLQNIGGVAGGAVGEQTARVIGALANANMKGAPFRANHSKQDAAKIAATINAIVGAGDIRMPELISGLGKGITASGKSVGINIKDMGAFVDLLTSMGTTGAVSGTYAAHAFQLLAGSSDKTRRWEEALGIPSGELLGKMNGKGGIASAAEDLMAHTTKLSAVDYLVSGKFTGQAAAEDIFKKAGLNPALLPAWEAGKLNKSDQMAVNQMLFSGVFGGGRQEMPLLTLMQNIDKFQGIRANIDKNSTTSVYNKDLARTMQTPKIQQDIQIRKLQASLIEIGQKIQPIFVDVLKGLTAITGFFMKFKGLLIELVAGLTLLMGTALVAKGAEIVGGVGKTLGGAAYGINTAKAKVKGLFGGAGEVKTGPWSQRYLAARAEQDAKNGRAMTLAIEQFGLDVETFTSGVAEMTGIPIGKTHPAGAGVMGSGSFAGNATATGVGRTMKYQNVIDPVTGQPAKSRSDAFRIKRQTQRDIREAEGLIPQYSSSQKKYNRIASRGTVGPTKSGILLSHETLQELGPGQRRNLLSAVGGETAYNSSVEAHAAKLMAGTSSTFGVGLSESKAREIAQRAAFATAVEQKRQNLISGFKTIGAETPKFLETPLTNYRQVQLAGTALSHGTKAASIDTRVRELTASNNAKKIVDGVDNSLQNRVGGRLERFMGGFGNFFRSSYSGGANMASNLMGGLGAAEKGAAAGIAKSAAGVSGVLVKGLSGILGAATGPIGMTIMAGLAPFTPQIVGAIGNWIHSWSKPDPNTQLNVTTAKSQENHAKRLAKQAEENAKKGKVFGQGGYLSSTALSKAAHGSAAVLAAGGAAGFNEKLNIGRGQEERLRQLASGVVQGHTVAGRGGHSETRATFAPGTQGVKSDNAGQYVFDQAGNKIYAYAVQEKLAKAEAYYGKLERTKTNLTYAHRGLTPPDPIQRFNPKAGIYGGEFNSYVNAQKGLIPGIGRMHPGMKQTDQNKNEMYKYLKEAQKEASQARTEQKYANDMALSGNKKAASMHQEAAKKLQESSKKLYDGAEKLAKDMNLSPATINSMAQSFSQALKSIKININASELAAAMALGSKSPLARS